MKNKVVRLPSIKDPIQPSPGFAKKKLATYKLDVMGLCGFGCVYCSSNSGNFLRMNRARFAAATKAQLGEAIAPVDFRGPGNEEFRSDPALAFAWPDVLDRLEAQIDRHRNAKGPGWGEGETLVFSQLTDAFSGPPLRDGTTRRALELVLERTRFRVRVLTKNSCVGMSRRWLSFFHEHRDRVVVGLSIGSLDDAWARAVEPGTPAPRFRVAAMRRLQDAGIPTFGMLCPVFPHVVAGRELDDLVDILQPHELEHLWAEPFNDRVNWRAVRAAHEPWPELAAWFDRVYGEGDRTTWSAYAAALYERLAETARGEGWIDKLRYLLYEDGVVDEHVPAFAGLDGVLLQSAKIETVHGPRSPHAGFRGLEEDARRFEREASGEAGLGPLFAPRANQGA